MNRLRFNEFKKMIACDYVTVLDCEPNHPLADWQIGLLFVSCVHWGSHPDNGRLVLVVHLEH